MNIKVGRIIDNSTSAKYLAAELVSYGIYFEADPQDNGEWIFKVKAEDESRFHTACLDICPITHREL